VNYGESFFTTEDHFLSKHDFIAKLEKGIFPLMEAGVSLHSFRNSFIPEVLVMVN
jgi:hypothetical protein